MSRDYAAFLESKRRVVAPLGMESNALPSLLYDWQAALVKWAVRRGRAALFCDCGLGKTFMQLAWSRALHVPTIILAPLCVAEQTVGEAVRLGIDVRYCRDQSDAGDHPIIITNYERLERFDVSRYGAVVLDESSILKAFDGETRNTLIRTFQETPYRLCCTATPSPNDITELANHAEFLGLMTRAEFLATWFIKIGEGHRTTTHHGWRMKRHAVDPFYRWMASWAMAVRSPKDIGYDDTAFRLPPLTVTADVLRSTATGGDSLFPELASKGIQGRIAARRTSLDDRVEAIAERAKDGVWMLWCGLNEEAAALARAIPDAVNISGSDDYDAKVSAVRRFVAGEIRVLISKPRILGFGMNFQHCHQMAFVGISDSYEAYYQCIRRCWRFGQQHPVTVVIVVSEAEQQVVENVRRKEAAAVALSSNLLEHMAAFERQEVGAV